MCGIAGICDWAGISDLSAVAVMEMLNLIRYRGPDETNYFRDPLMHFGSCRLAIIALEPDAQPVANEDGSIQCVFNGEIYNHLELREELQARGHRLRTRSDSEVLVHLYEDFGSDFVHHLNGMFAIAIWDRRRRELLLARDRFGAKPVFYFRNGSQFGFASELKALLLVQERDPALDPEAIADYFSFGFVPHPRTIYRGLHALPPGHLLRVRERGEESMCYWAPPPLAPDEGKAEKTALAELEELLDDAVRLRLRSDVPVGFFLSGGVDSSVLVSCSAARGSSELKTFSVGFEEGKFSELDYARQVAALCGTQHRECLVTPTHLAALPRVQWHCDQPHGDASFLAVHLLSEMAARDVTVVLSGEGADEILYGYRKYLNVPEVNATERWNGLRRYWAEAMTIFAADELAQLAPSLRGCGDRLEPMTDRLRPRVFTTLTDDAVYLDQTVLLPANNLVKPDRQGSAHALETRFPYLDYRLAEFVARLPFRLKIKAREPKYLLKQVGLKRLPWSLLMRPKQMFTVPVGEWMRSGALDVAEHPAVLANPLLNQGFVRELAAQHREGSANHTRKLRTILSFAVWCDVAAASRRKMDGLWRTPPRESRLVMDASLAR